MRSIELKDDDPDTVERMISFMYNLDYKDEQNTDPQPASPETGQHVDDEAGKIIDTITLTDEEDVHEPLANIHKYGIPGRGDSQPALFSSVRVYAIADKYDIPPLKDLARQRFGDWAETNWDCVEFPAMVKEVFESTPSTDRGLREVVFELVTNHVDVLLKKEYFRSVTEGIGELGLGVLLQLVEKHSEEKLDVLDHIEELETRASLLKVRLLDCERNLAEKSRELATTTSRINELYKCRHCGQSFSIELENSRVGGAAVIRCTSCRTRH